MAESQVVYQKGRQAKESYTDRGGVRQPIDPKDRKIESLRRELNYERWENREWRQRQFFGPYYSYPPVVMYHDPYSSFFWWWLLDRSLDDRAYWAYHHRQSMDDARYRDLLARDANLQARIQQLEAQRIPRDPTYRPGNMDLDLMYSNSYVEAAYNPQPLMTLPVWGATVVGLMAPPLGDSPFLAAAALIPERSRTITAPDPAPLPTAAHNPSRHVSSGTAVRAMIMVFIVMVMIGLTIWLVFYKRWGSIGG
jgi:hypothetical protein